MVRRSEAKVENSNQPTNKKENLSDHISSISKLSTNQQPPKSILLLACDGAKVPQMMDWEDPGSCRRDGSGTNLC